MSNPIKIQKKLNDERVTLGYLVHKKRNNDCDSSLALRLSEYFVGTPDKYVVPIRTWGGGEFGAPRYDFNLLFGREFTALWFLWIYLEALCLPTIGCVHWQLWEVGGASWVSRLIKRPVVCFAAAWSRLIDGIWGMLPRLNPMQKSSPYHSVRRLHARLCQQLVLHANTNGETSPALEVAFYLAGSRVSVSPLPSSILYNQKIEGTGLHIKGSQASVVWCSSGSLAAIRQVASAHNSRYAANWEGLIDLELSESSIINNKSAECTDQSSKYRFKLLLHMLGFMLVSAAYIPTLHASTDQPGVPLVRNGAALGDNLLERLGAAASKAGFQVEFASVLSQGGGLKMVLPGLVLTPVAGRPDIKIRLPVTIPLGRSERLSISLHALTRPTDPLPDGAAVKIVLRQVFDGKVVAEQTTKFARAWSTPDLLWLVDHDRATGELVLEIIPEFSGPLKVTLPQGLLLPASLL